MDAQAKKKALFRAKLNGQKQEKRIDSPLVRYNENDQPVCRVCEVVLKSDFLWPAHLASRKHHEAVNNLKANAASLPRTNNVKREPSKEFTKAKAEDLLELSEKPQPSASLPKSRPSSMLPPGFFDNPEAKREKKGTEANTSTASSNKKSESSAQRQEVQLVDSLNQNVELPSEDIVSLSDNEITLTLARGNDTASRPVISSEGSRHVKGALPAGFFDDKDADLRARGITPVKPDAKDEYKEFEKLIQEDLQEIDNRLEEEEVDAADMIEVLESVEQRTHIGRVDMLKRKKLELKAARSSNKANGRKIIHQEPSHEESSSDDDSDDNFTVDWRAKHL